VVTGLQWAKTHKPAIGWVRADRVAADEARVEIAELREKVAQLELEIEKRRGREIAHFEDRIEGAKELVPITLIAKTKFKEGDEFKTRSEALELKYSKTKIIQNIAVVCLTEMRESAILLTMQRLLFDKKETYD
jgi:hypothetical protein